MGPLIWVGSLIGALLGYHVLLFIYNIYFHPLRNFPGRKLDAISQLNTSYHLIKGDYSKYVASLHEKYGNIVRTGPREISYSTSTAFTEIHGHKSRAEDVYEKNGVIYIQGSGKITNIFFAQHNEHARYKKFISPAFSEAAIREQEPTMTSFIDLFIQSMRNRSGVAYYPNQDGIVNLAAWYTFIIFDLLSSLAFGGAVGCLENGDYHPWVPIIYGAVKHSTYIQAATRLNPYGKLLKRLIPGGVDAEYERHMEFATKTLAERQGQIHVARSDFLSFVSKGLTQEELVDNVNIIVVAGGETTATTLAAITYYITHNLSSYNRLTTEIREAFETEDQITITEVLKLKYLKAVIDETLRIHPPIPVGLPRVVPKGGRVIDGKFVPGGTWVSVSSMACCRLSQYFRDADKFIPERWLDDPKFASDHREVFHPFLIGPRTCVATHLANVNMRLIIARLLWNFDLEAQSDNIDPHDQKEMGIWEGTPLRTKLVERTWDFGAGKKDILI